MCLLVFCPLLADNLKFRRGEEEENRKFSHKKGVRKEVGYVSK